MKHQIIIKNPIEAQCGPLLAPLIKGCISFPTVFYRQGMWKKERKESTSSFLTKGKGGIHWFWAGLVDRVVFHCIENDIDVEVIDESQEDIIVYEAELPGITFRPDQIRLINSFLDNPRGILVAPTGTGKTVLGFGCLSGFDNIKTLWLCHKIDLVTQAYDEARKFGFKSVGRVGGKWAEYDCDLTIATRQSFRNLTDEYGHLYDAVVVDETHHVANMKSEYAYVLSRVPAPIRLGLTATLPREGESYLTSMGLIGPIREELTINEGNDLGILAKPTIKILRLKKNYEVESMRKYSDVYSAAVTQNLALNTMVAVTAKQHADLNETVLIMINHIEHGKNIMEQLKALKVDAFFVHGATEGERRSEVKKALNDGHIKVVVCSSVWTEGVNIPNLNAVINAGGGKSEIRTLQNIGRGLRKTKDKDKVFIYDFFNPSHRFLLDHFGERICTYSENDWL